MPNRIAVVFPAVDDDLRRAADAGRSAGFDGLLLPAWSASFSPCELTASGRRDVRRILASANQALVGLSMALEGRGLAPGADVDQALDRAERAMESAAGLGSPLLCLDVGPLPAPPPAPRPARPAITPAQAGRIIIPGFADAPPPVAPTAPPPAPADPAFVAQVDAALAELGRRADRYSVTIAMRSGLAGFAAVERAMRAADCPWFGVDLDPAAVLSDDWPLDEVFSRLGPLIRHVRCRDAVTGADKRTRPAVVGRGDVDWRTVLACLDEAAYRGWLTVDPLELPDRAAAAAAALRHLRSAS